MYTCTCIYCGNQFEARRKDVKVCNPCKSRPCIICGKSFTRDWPYDQKACSDECRKELYKERDCDPKVNQKRQQTCLERYGVLNAFDIPENFKPDAVTSKESLRACKACGKLFDPKGTTRQYCRNTHYRVCTVCGKKFKVDPRTRRETCSKDCKSKLHNSSMNPYTKICELCGKPFLTTWVKTKYCSREHLTTCSICGNRFQIPPTRYADPPKTCSNPSCRTAARKQTCLAKYGVDVATKSPEVRRKLSEAYVASIDKRVATVMERYGIDHHESL